jgi:phenylalanyl-tRNA synthetase beta chain
MGIELEPSVVTQILNNLGFETIHKSSGTYQTMVPSWRSSDVELPIDVVEEIARVYGYHNLPNAIQQTTFVPQPHELELLFYVQAKIKYFLKHIGVHEVMNYSMVSRKLLESMDLRPDDHLELLNTISEEIQFFRQSLIPSLVKNISENEGRRDVLKFFEISKVYLPRKSELPEEVYKLSIAVNTDFLDLKGLVESLITELKAGDIAYDTSNQPLFSEALQTSLSVADKKLGMLGQLKPAHQERNAIKSPVYIAELDLMPLIELYRPVAAYKAASQYATIKLDLTIEQKERSYAEIRKNAFAASSLLSDTEVVSQYNDKLSIRFYFNSPDKNITENEAKVELDKIKNTL